MQSWQEWPRNAAVVYEKQPDGGGYAIGRRFSLSSSRTRSSDSNFKSIADCCWVNLQDNMEADNYQGSRTPSIVRLGMLADARGDHAEALVRHEHVVGLSDQGMDFRSEDRHVQEANVMSLAELDSRSSPGTLTKADNFSSKAPTICTRRRNEQR